MQIFFGFSDLIALRGLPVEGARLVRHDRLGAEEYHRGRAYFGDYITYQGAGLDPFKGASVAFQFIPGPALDDGDASALFVGAHHVGESWLVGDGSRRPTLHHDESRYWPRAPTDRAYQLDPLPEFEDLTGRVLIRWGAPNSARAWSQWAHRQNKEIVELRRTVSEPDFPGFSLFSTTLEGIASLPPTWRAALASVKGVYLLVSPDTGDQYVGSAYGADGFIGRWDQYFRDGHGGNKLLRARGRVDYAISILEIASPDMSDADIIHRESTWKSRLGSRAHGLNAN